MARNRLWKGYFGCHYHPSEATHALYLNVIFFISVFRMFLSWLLSCCVYCVGKTLERGTMAPQRILSYNAKALEHAKQHLYGQKSLQNMWKYDTFSFSKLCFSEVSISIFSAGFGPFFAQKIWFWSLFEYSQCPIDHKICL